MDPALGGLPSHSTGAKAVMKPGVADEVMLGLKDFQRTTVDHVFDRLYAKDGSGRFLVADEVGLGKTLVARGVIAKTIDLLRARQIARIDIVYICSSGEIARQNINRLKVGDEDHVPLVSRLTLLPQELHRLKATKNGVNFISFTPGTSFDVRSGLGLVNERVLLYWLLREVWAFGEGKAPMNVFRGNAGADRFRDILDAFDPDLLADESKQEFAKALDRHLAVDRASGKEDLATRFEFLCREYNRFDRSISSDVSSERARFVGELRSILAASCVNALEPDLIILDEFQRFAHLLDGEDDASRLARELFTYRDVRVLLLSATPYKMYTTADDAAGEDHYRDFVRTLRFLERSDSADASLEKTVAAYREGLLSLGEGASSSDLKCARQDLEQRLRRVMVRTERLASTQDRNGMLVEMPSRPMHVDTKDLTEYVAIQRLAREVGSDDILELWKSSPFLMNFLDDEYKLKRKVNEALETPEDRARLARSLMVVPSAMLPWAQAERYGDLESGNARFRALVDDVVGCDAWRLLWIPPSLAYYRLSGPFAAPGLASFTKRLIFSSWRVVPRAIAALISYEVERRMFAGDQEARNTPDYRRGRRGPLRFAVSEGRLTGMPVLALLYPSLYLAHIGDPTVLVAERARERASAAGRETGDGVTLEDILASARERIEVGLRRLGAPPEGQVDERWYWAAPLLLDRALDPDATRAWLDQDDLAAEWSGQAAEEQNIKSNRESAPPSHTEREEADAWRKHVEQAIELALGSQGSSGMTDLGRMPEDLVDVLALLAVAGPAVSMFRALDRVVGGEARLSTEARNLLRNGAGRTAWSFRALFNQPDVMSMLRSGIRAGTTIPYWKSVLQYCAEGCLPAVLDEYVHVLRDHLGLVSGSIGDRVHEIGDEIQEAVELRTSRVNIDEYTVGPSERTVRRESRNMRTHFALRFANGNSDDGGVLTRTDHVRKAFNSPFWPFVLATTSVGQEGLDFHTYCHAVVHWNLPSNPVDLEQREGRVHRYKGHAIRKNVAMAHGQESLEAGEPDPWQAMFDRARISSPGTTEIVPFWVYPVEGGARIERHVFTLPMSREHGQASRLRSSLALYRMVFGQPRQEDLLRYLLGRVNADDLDRIMADARIELSPGVGLNE
jgi:hypothetical protein